MYSTRTKCCFFVGAFLFAFVTYTCAQGDVLKDSVVGCDISSPDVNAGEARAKKATTAKTEAIEKVTKKTTKKKNVKIDFWEEREKWNYLREKFGISLKDYTTFSSKIGSFMNNHAFLLSLPMGGIGLGLGLAGGIGFECVVSDDNNFSFVRGAGIMVGAASISLLLSYAFYKITGSWLEAKPKRALAILTSYFSQWSINKSRTPLLLQDVFEELYLDFKTHNGSFTKTDGNQACLIVENVLATSLIAGILE